jgi:hypothetical protein
MALGFGLGLLLLGLAASLGRAHIRGQSYFNRPRIAQGRLFDPLLALATALLLLTGLYLIGRASPPVMVATSAALLVLWGYRRVIRSLRFQRWLLRRDFDRLKRERPGRPDPEILYLLVHGRHPRWAQEMLEQMIADYPTVDELARILSLMERNVRGYG